MNIAIITIPHKQQRYPTVGDWQWGDDNLTITVSQLGDWRYETLVACHEFIEAMICRYSGITQESVDKFDIAYEKRRKHGDYSEPGDSKDAPYYLAHQFATGIERFFAFQLGVSWDHYNTVVENL